MVEATEGSHVHGLIKTDEQLTLTCKEVLEKGLVNNAVERVIILLLVRHCALGEFVTDKLSPSTAAGDLFDIVGQYWASHDYTRFLDSTFMPNGLPQSYCTDLQGYTLPDVMGVLGQWLYDSNLGLTGDDENWRLSEEQVVTALKSTTFRRGYVLMLPHVLGTLWCLDRYAEENLTLRMKKTGSNTTKFLSWCRTPSNKRLTEEEILAGVKDSWRRMRRACNTEDEITLLDRLIQHFTVAELRGAGCKFMQCGTNLSAIGEGKHPDDLNNWRQVTVPNLKPAAVALLNDDVNTRKRKRAAP